MRTSSSNHRSASRDIVHLSILLYCHHCVCYAPWQTLYQLFSPVSSVCSIQSIHSSFLLCNDLITNKMCSTFLPHLFADSFLLPIQLVQLSGAVVESVSWKKKSTKAERVENNKTFPNTNITHSDAFEEEFFCWLESCVFVCFFSLASVLLRKGGWFHLVWPQGSVCGGIYTGTCAVRGQTTECF